MTYLNVIAHVFHDYNLVVSCFFIFNQFSVCFKIGFQLSANSSMPLPSKGQRGVTMATNFGTKIAINAFLSEIMRL